MKMLHKQCENDDENEDGAPWSKMRTKNEDGTCLSCEMKRRKFSRSYVGGALSFSVTNNNDGIVNNASLVKQTLLE